MCLCVYAQSSLTLFYPMFCSTSGLSVHGIFQAKILEQVAIFYSRGSSRSKDRTASLKTPTASLKTPTLAIRFFTLGHLGFD